jgi:hypothetical protein
VSAGLDFYLHDCETKKGHELVYSTDTSDTLESDHRATLTCTRGDKGMLVTGTTMRQADPPW